MVECRFEPLAYLLMNGLPNLTLEAWHELEHEHKNYPYGPDWEEYQRSENNGTLRFISLREEKRLIGYASILLVTDLHHAGLMLGIYRDIYITRSKRGYAAIFIRYIEKELSCIGINRALIGERVASGNKASLFYKALGYELQEYIHGKTLNSGVINATRH